MKRRKKIVLEALESTTLKQCTTKYKISLSTLHNWRRQFMDDTDVLLKEKSFQEKKAIRNRFNKRGDEEEESEEIEETEENPE